MKGAMTLTEMLKEVRTIGGYAAGDYFSKCHACERTFMGDKLARECLVCAVKNLEQLAARAKSEENRVLFGGIKIEMDPAMPPDQMEFHHADGRVDRFKL